MKQNEFAARVKPWLERSAAQVGEMQATRLKAARLRALDAMQEPVRLLGVVKVSRGTAQLVHYSLVQRAYLWLPVVALLVAIAIQTMGEREVDLGELDAQLLTQELPPDAFLDQDFRAWLGKQR